MRHLIVLTLALAFLGFSSSAGMAESTIACHCFKDRSFDHDNPGKVVPYLLATTQNSFLAVAFNTKKFQLVKDLMGGVPSDRLWIAHYFAAGAGLQGDALLVARTQHGSWRAALAALGLPPQSFAPQIVALLGGAEDEAQLAAAVVDATLLETLLVDADQLRQLRTAGAENRETILSFFLAKRTGQEATALYRSVAGGITDWGTLAKINNVQIGKMEAEFRRLLK